MIWPLNVMKTISVYQALKLVTAVNNSFFPSHWWLFLPPVIIKYPCSKQLFPSIPQYLCLLFSSSTRGDYSHAGKKEKFRYATTLVFIQCIINAAFARLCESNLRMFWLHVWHNKWVVSHYGTTFLPICVAARVWIRSNSAFSPFYVCSNSVFWELKAGPHEKLALWCVFSVLPGRHGVQ